MWVLRYLWELFKWAFGRWRIHQAIVSVVSVVFGLVGWNWFSVHQPAIPIYLVGWLAFYTFIIAPACLWHQQNDKLHKEGKIPKFSGTISITYPANEEIISFLETNNRRIVFLDTHIDASVGIEEQWKIVQKERIDLDLITSGKFSGIPLPLPNKDGIVNVTFYFRDDHALRFSAGGTGVVMVSINGFFEVSRTVHRGPTLAFHLDEIEASLEKKIEMQNR
jgi:hypothetical protein